MTNAENGRIFYGWWVVAAAFLNLFFAVGIIFYGFPALYASFVESLGFSRAQVTQGFFLGFLLIGLPCGLLAGAVIDRIGAQWVIVAGVGFVGISLLLMAKMTKLWQYEALCVLEVLGYVFAGPIANQVLVSKWFRARRGRAMGLAYLGLGAGGVVAPLLVNYLIRTCGWRHAVEIVALAMLAGSLAGRILVGYAVDHVRKKNAMAFFYFLMGASVLLLGMASRPAATWTFAFIFGFSMGADYMLVPLVTAESFGTASLGKLLGLIIMGYSLGQWGLPWIVGRLFDARHTYDLAWKITALAGMIGGLAIYAVSP